MTSEYTFVLEVAASLTAFTHPNHIAYLCSGDSLTCRLAAAPITLGSRLKEDKNPISLANGGQGGE
jgi:hypothetical protein